MITKYKKRHRIIATVFLLIFFPTLIPNNLFASNNGPKSPEAASFEPVDATDMVNLITGQYSYVLPLLNVPSPGGGYPLALSYHAGITMDEESSWAGLGWNVNPGAIDRTVNGYPDDYKTQIAEYYYDEGGTNYHYAVSVGYSYGVGSVGLGFNWGSNQALGGSVSVGVGLDAGNGNKVGVGATVGSSGASVNVGIQTASGLAVGISADTNNDIGFNLGFCNTNGEGLSIGYNTNGTKSISAQAGIGNDNLLSMSCSFSSTGKGFGIGVTNKTSKTIDGGVGIGFNTTFNTTSNMLNYNTSSSGWGISLFVPTNVGVFSGSYGEQKFKYTANSSMKVTVFGPIYYSGLVYAVVHIWQGASIYDYFYTYEEALAYKNEQQALYPQYNYTLSNSPLLHNPAERTRGGEKHFDIYEFPVDEDLDNSIIDIEKNNVALPSYDNYTVQSQGLSGSMSPTIYENGALMGLSERDTKKEYKVFYSTDKALYESSNEALFESKPFFYFENEISSYYNVNDPEFNENTTNGYIFNYLNLANFDTNPKPRRKVSNYIEYYTNNQIISTYSKVKNEGYLNPSVTGFDRNVMPKNGIGAFKITSVDGKTYHYSLPVYNFEMITRTFGFNAQRPGENQSYLEKQQLEPFATHWLLTAVTGPDYIDNGDGVAGDGDLGYWVSFDYGKWTDAFVWKAPFKKDYIEGTDDKNAKTWIKGRKQLYYLDRIKTRTHTALFIKSERNDSRSEIWNYSASYHNLQNPFNNPYLPRFTVPSQNQLKLDKIILLKNEDNQVQKEYGNDLNQGVNINFQYNYPINGKYAVFNVKDNVLDIGDNWSSSISKAIKVIDFQYDNSLVPGDNRLTLKNVDFKGKSGSSVLPPYKFEYNNDSQNFNIDDKDPWGYNYIKGYQWSLKNIITPQGANIGIEYEKGKFKCVTPVKFKYSNLNTNEFMCTTPAISNYYNLATFSNKVIISNSKLNIPIVMNQSVEVDFNQAFSYAADNESLSYYIHGTYQGLGHITQTPSTLGVGKYEVTFDGNVVYTAVEKSYLDDGSAVADYAEICDININVSMNNDVIYEMGPARVKNIKITDGVSTFTNEYKYGYNEDGVGYVTYLPFLQNIFKDIPYSSQLPAPRIMYDYVTLNSYSNALRLEGKIRYKFNVIKKKDYLKIKFGDIFSIEKTSKNIVNTANCSRTDRTGEVIPCNKSVNAQISKYEIKNNLASIGQLLEVATFNSQGQLLSKINNSYYDINEIPNNIGVTKESYQSFKIIDYNNPITLDKWNVNSTSRVKYPSIIKSSTEQKNGYSYTTQFNDYDLISGISKEQIYTSSDGQSFKTKTIPAYIKYLEMGSKVDNIGNKNMLSQTAANYSYILDKGTNAWKETGVGITTWSNIWSYKDIAGVIVSVPAEAPPKDKIWRKHKTYVWNGVKDTNGIFQSYDSTNGGDDGFVWGVGLPQPSNSKWKQTSEVTLYDHFSAPLEMKDINNNLASTKMGDGDTKVMATGNAGYNEMFFAGAENITGAENVSGVGTNWLEPEVKMINAKRNTRYFHTGKRSIEATNSSQFGASLGGPLPNGIPQHRSGKYKVSVWVEKSNAAKAVLKVNNAIENFQSDVILAGNWQLKTAYINVPPGACTVYLSSADTSTVYFDDLMIRPLASSITGYVYNEWDELTHIIGNNGLATQFEYDAAGRLVKTSVEVIDAGSLKGGFKLTTMSKINYKNLK